jgi:hypothetical protein
MPKAARTRAVKYSCREPEAGRMAIIVKTTTAKKK